MVKKQLSSYIDSDKNSLPHALIFQGPDGVGKRTMANILARAVCCADPNPENRPCDKCNSCKKALNLNHPDIQQIQGDGAARSFHISVIRQIREDAYILPNEAPKRVIILADAHNMTQQAQNALLKLMEEPPAHLILILTCQNKSQLLQTIQSRGVLLSFQAPEKNEAIDIVLKLCPDISSQNAENALIAFGGVIGQAVLGLSNDKEMSKIMELAPQIALAVISPMELDLLKATAGLNRDTALTDGVLSALKLIFRDALVLSANPHAPTMSISPDSALELCRALDKKSIMNLINEVELLQQARLRYINQNLLITLLCSNLRKAANL